MQEVVQIRKWNSRKICVWISIRNKYHRFWSNFRSNLFLSIVYAIGTEISIYLSFGLLEYTHFNHHTCMKEPNIIIYCHCHFVLGSSNLLICMLSISQAISSDLNLNLLFLMGEHATMHFSKWKTDTPR